MMTAHIVDSCCVINYQFVFVVYYVIVFPSPCGWLCNSELVSYPLVLLCQYFLYIISNVLFLGSSIIYGQSNVAI